MTDLDLDLDALQALADAATPDPYWEVGNDEDEHDVTVVVDQESGRWLGVCPDCGVRAGFERSEAEYLQGARPANIRQLIERVRAAEAETIDVSGGALIDEAEQRTRRIHAEVERDMARQELTSADAMHRHWDELNAERDLLRARLEACQERCWAEHPSNPSVVACVLDRGHVGDHMSTTGCAGSVMKWARIEDGIRALADEMATQDPATNLAGVETWADRLRALLSHPDKEGGEEFGRTQACVSSGCSCKCHESPHVKHIAPCCDHPPVTEGRGDE